MEFSQHSKRESKIAKELFLATLFYFVINPHGSAIAATNNAKSHDIVFHATVVAPTCTLDIESADNVFDLGDIPRADVIKVNGYTKKIAKDLFFQCEDGTKIVNFEISGNNINKEACRPLYSMANWDGLCNSAPVGAAASVSGTIKILYTNDLNQSDWHSFNSTKVVRKAKVETNGKLKMKLDSVYLSPLKSSGVEGFIPGDVTLPFKLALWLD